MTVTAIAPLTPEADVILSDLVRMTAHWDSLREPAMFELRALAEGKRDQWAQFTPGRIAEAVLLAEDMNREGYNIYAVRNPIKLGHIGAANDNAILAAFFCWADCDDSVSTDNVHRFDGPKCTWSVKTGSTPGPRMHVYWELDEPVNNLAAWRDMQIAIAHHFQSDRVVINPSRIMRVAGTVSYPNSKKQARGYASEFCTIRTEYGDDRDPVAFERLMRVFPPVAPAPVGGAALDIAAGPQQQRVPLDRERAALRARSGEEWHNQVIRLVASYVQKGLADAEIHAITDRFTIDGYTIADTRREVQTAIDGARRKGWARASLRLREVSDAEIETILPAPFKPWVEIDLAQIPGPEFVYSDFYARGYTSVTLAAPKVGKSLLGLAEAIDMATGLGFLTGRRRDPLRVLQRRGRPGRNQRSRRGNPDALQHLAVRDRRSPLRQLRSRARRFLPCQRDGRGHQ